MAAEPSIPSDVGQFRGPVGSALDPAAVGDAIAAGLRALATATGSSSSALFTRDGTAPATEIWHSEADPPEPLRSAMRTRAQQALESGAPPTDAGPAVFLLRTAGKLQGALCLSIPQADTGQLTNGPLGNLLQMLGWQAAAYWEMARAQSVRAQYGRWFRQFDEQVRVLDRERQKFAAIVHRSDAWVFVTDPERTIRWTNSALAAHASAEGISWIGRGCDAVCANFHGRSHSGPSPCNECPVAQALEQNRVVHREFRRSEAGQVHSLYLSALPIKGLDGKPQEAMVMIQDLSGLESLRQSESRYRLLFERSAKAILLVDPTTRRILLANPMASRMTGFAPEELLGLTLAGLHSECEWRRLDPVYAAGLRENGLGSHECLLQARDGSVRQAVLSGTSHDLDGHEVLMLEYLDLTERKMLEERLRHAQRMEAIGRLAGGVAHDFNNLLAAILGHSELMLARLEPGHPMRRSLEDIQRASTRGSLLTRQLLAFSRKDVLTPTIVDLNAVVLAIETMLRRLIGEDIELTVVPSAEPAPVHADRGQLEQIVMNLAVNARDAMPRGGHLTIEVHNLTLDQAYAQQHPDLSPGAHTVLSVADNGCGMDPETLAHAFEPFYTTKERGKGTGLGLSTVYGIVQQNRGHVCAHSEPGLGTSFKVYFPRASEAPAAGDAAEAPVPSAGGVETVLLVEDEDSVRSVARQVLEANGYRVFEARNGAEALEIAADHDGPIHMVVTDVVMPLMGGAELTRRLAAQRPGLRVLYMSGYTDDAVVRHGVLDRSTAFLQKPFPLAALVQKVREVLDEPRVDPRQAFRQ